MIRIDSDKILKHSDGAILLKTNTRKYNKDGQHNGYLYIKSTLPYLKNK